MGKTFIMDHPLIQHKIGIIRRKETGTKDFSRTPPPASLVPLPFQAYAFTQAEKEKEAREGSLFLLEFLQKSEILARLETLKENPKEESTKEAKIQNKTDNSFHNEN